MQDGDRSLVLIVGVISVAVGATPRHYPLFPSSQGAAASTFPQLSLFPNFLCSLPRADKQCKTKEGRGTNI